MRYSVLLFFGTAILCWLFLAVSTRISTQMVLIIASMLHLSVIIAIWADGRNTLRAYQDEENIISCRVKELEKDINEIRFHLKLDTMHPDPPRGCSAHEDMILMEL